MKEEKRYAQVGIGGRAAMYYEAIASTFSDTSRLIGFCDVNQTRMDYAFSFTDEKLVIMSASAPSF